MRILHTADWHLGKMLEQVSRLEEQREFITELCDIAEKEAVDLILIAGDIYDTYNPSAKAEELFYDAMVRLNREGKVPLVVISGNHDNPERLCASKPLAIKNGIFLFGYPGDTVDKDALLTPHVSVVDSGSGWMELKLPQYDYSAVILPLSYPSEARLNEVLTNFCEEALIQKAYEERVSRLLKEGAQQFRKDTVNLIVSHLFLLGGKESDSERTLSVGGAMTVRGALLPENADYIALGHLHRPQKIKDAASLTYYAGSPLAYSFSESGYTKAVYILDAQPGKPVVVEEHLLSAGRPLRRWKAESIEMALNWCREGRDAKAWVDVEIVTDRIISGEEQQEMRKLHPGILQIRPVIQSAASGAAETEQREGKKVEDLFRAYYQAKKGVEISEPLMETLLEILYQDDTAAEEGDAP